MIIPYFNSLYFCLDKCSRLTGRTRPSSVQLSERYREDTFLLVNFYYCCWCMGIKPPSTGSNIACYIIFYTSWLWALDQTSTHVSPANDACTGRHSFEVLLKKLWKCTCLWISYTINLICPIHKFTLKT